MKAAFFRKPGGPEVVEWGEMPFPCLKEEEVLVKVSAVAANPVDTYIRSGKYPLPPGASLPYIIGTDMVGVVDKIGKKAKKFKPGDRVWSCSFGSKSSQGCFAEYASIDEGYLFKAPEKIDAIEIVASLLGSVTACYGLMNIAKLKASDLIFVNGGAGSVGSAIIQLSKECGVRVFTATGGEEKKKWCESIGADLVLDHSDDLNAKVREVAPDGVNIFWNTSRKHDFDLSVSMLGRNGKIVLMSGTGDHPPFPVGPFYSKSCSMEGFTINTATADQISQCADVINLALEQKALKVKIAKILPLSELAKAHVLIEAVPELWGKIVLTF